MLTIRPYRRSFMPGATARVQTNVLVRFASTTACQSASETSSSGRPTWPTTPPALLTRMSTRPIPATRSATCPESLTSTVSRSCPCTTAPCASSAAAMPAPIPCAVPVTSATRPVRSGIPTVLEQRPDLLDARRPDTEDVGLRPLVGAAERAVAEQIAHIARIELAHPRHVRHRFRLGGKLDTRQPRPREVLEPRRVRRVGVDLVHDVPHPLTRPPVMPPQRSVGACLGPRLGGGAATLVAAVPVHEQEASEPLVGERAEQVDEQRGVRLDLQRRAARMRGEVRREPIRQRGHHEHAERIGRFDRDPLGQDPVNAERQVPVLLDRAERDHEPVLVAEVLLDLHPVAVLDPHGATPSYASATDRSTASFPPAAASWSPAGSEPSASPQGSEIAGAPAMLYGPVNRPSTSPCGVPKGGSSVGAG